MIFVALMGVMLSGSFQRPTSAPSKVNGAVRLEKRTLYPYGNMTAKALAVDTERERVYVVHGTSITILDTRDRGERISFPVLHAGEDETPFRPAEHLILDAPVFDFALYDPASSEASNERLFIAGGTSGLLAMDVGDGEGAKDACSCSDLGLKSGCFQVTVIDDREDSTKPSNEETNNGWRWCRSVEIYDAGSIASPREFALALFSAAGSEAGVPHSQLRCYALPEVKITWALDLVSPPVHQPGHIADYPVAYDLEVDPKQRAAYIAMGTAGICRVDLSGLESTPLLDEEKPSSLPQGPVPSATMWWHPEDDLAQLDAMAPLPAGEECAPGLGCGRALACDHCYSTSGIGRAGLGFNPNSKQHEAARVASLSLIAQDGALYATADARGLLALDVSDWLKNGVPALRDAKVLVPSGVGPSNTESEVGCEDEIYYAYAIEVQAIRTRVTDSPAAHEVAHDLFVAGSRFPCKITDRSAPWVPTGIWGHNLSVAKDTFASRVCPEAALKPYPAGDLFLFRRMQNVPALGSKLASWGGALRFLRRYEDFQNDDGAKQPYWYRDRAFAIVPRASQEGGVTACVLYNQVAKHGLFSFSYDPNDLGCDLSRERSYVPRLFPCANGPSRSVATPNVFGVASSLYDPRLLFVSQEGTRCGILNLGQDLEANPGSYLGPIACTPYAHQFGLLPIGAQWLGTPEESERSPEYFLRTQSFGDYRLQGWALTRIDSSSAKTLQKPSKYWLIPSRSVRDDFDGDVSLSGSTYFTSSQGERAAGKIILSRAGTRYGAFLTSTRELSERAEAHGCACEDSTRNLRFLCGEEIGENIAKAPHAPTCILDVRMVPIDTHPELADWRFEDPTREPLDAAVPDPRRILWHENASPGTLSFGKRRYYGTNLYTWEAELFRADLVGDAQLRHTAVLAAGYHADDRAAAMNGQIQTRCTDLLGGDPSRSDGFTFADAADCHFSKAMIVLADLDFGLPETSSTAFDATDGEPDKILFGTEEQLFDSEAASTLTASYGSSASAYGIERVIRPFAAGYGNSLAGNALAVETARVHGRRYAFVADLAGRLLLFDVSDDVLQVAKLTYLERTRGATKCAYDGSAIGRPVALPLVQEVELPPNYLDGDIDNITDLLYSAEEIDGKIQHILYVTAGRAGLMRMRLKVWSGTLEELEVFEPQPDCGEISAVPYPPLPRYLEIPPVASAAVEIFDTAGIAQSIERVSQQGKEALVIGDQMAGIVIFGEY